jgi:ABC-type Mn2+/Zn2+ transport system permease subunit
MFGKGFKKTAIISVVISTFSVTAGIAISYIVNLAPAGVIVVISIMVFLAALPAKHWIKKYI